MNLEVFKSKIRQTVYKASFELRDDVLAFIKRAYKQEVSSSTKNYLKTIIDNAQIADKKELAICQDTGFPVVFLELGRNTKLDNSLIKVISSEIEKAYKDFSLRASITDPLKRDKSGFGPIEVHIEYSDNNFSKLSLLLKGFGSENKSKLYMLNPNEDITGYVLDAVKKAGPEACPPFIIGIGLGGTSDKALFLAKKALLEGIGSVSSDKEIAILEKKIFLEVNKLKIGPMGLGGKTTALAVKIKTAPTHIAGLSLGININCWALRSASFTF